MRSTNLRADGALMETILKPQLAFVLAGALLGLSACVVEPYAYGGGGGGALAQSPAVDATNSPSQNETTNGPAGTYDMTTTRTTTGPNGAQTDTTERFDKTQSYSSGNGALTARTHIETTGPATTPDTSH